MSAQSLSPVPHSRHVLTGEPLTIVIAVLAIAVPAMLTYSVPPSATFLNQAASVVGWGLLLASFARAVQWPMLARSRGLAALLTALAVMLVAALGSMVWAALPPALALSTAMPFAMAMLAATVGAAIAEAGQGGRAWRALCWALATAGLLSVVVSAIQVFVPDAADGHWIVVSAATGRASGNLRQPNHLSSLLLWSAIAAQGLAESGRLQRGVAVAFVLGFVFTLVLTASRTGVVGVGMLALWGALDRRLSKPARALLVITPVAYLLFWSGLAVWAYDSFGGEARLTDTADSPNSRLHIWANALSLIATHRWLGVGFGEFNFAWSLTPFPNRPTAFFDHTHNLPLQLAVELGVPLATLIVAALAWVLWRAFVVSCRAPMPQALMLRAGFMMVLTIALHSLLEYPLWYAYFLLPAAFVLGLCLGADADPELPASGLHQARNSTRGSRALLLAAVLMAVGGVLSVVDYLRVVAIFTADEDAAPLAERIEAGKKSILFAHHAHYAAATTAEHPAEVLDSFKIASHYLLDTRLMMAWATALHESGDVERARYLAARLREFRNPDSKPFFAPCDEPNRLDVEKPFQCFPSTKNFSFEDFR